MAKCYLKTQQGEYLKVCSKGKEKELVAIDSQHHGVVYIQTREVNQRKQMSFKFPYKKEYYFLKVEGKSIKLVNEKESVADDSSTGDGLWFEKVNLGSADVYSLKTVVETPQYLTMQHGSKRRGIPLSLTPELQECLCITDEKA